MRTHRKNAVIGTAVAMVAACVCCAAAGDLPEGIVALWQAEGNSQDSMGENHGSPVGGVSFSKGIEGQCFNFDGTSGYIDLTNTGDLDFGTSNFTVCAWAFFNSTGNGLSYDQTLFHKVLGSYPNDRGYFIEYNGQPEPALRFMVRDTTGNQNDLILPVSICGDHWVHITGVRSGNVNRIYLNGEQLGEQEAGSNIDIGIGGDARIGSIKGLHGTARYFRGLLDEVSLYGRALSPSEIYSLATMRPQMSLRTVLDQVEISWTSQSNRSYEVRYSSNLLTNSWTSIGSPIVATGCVSRAYDSLPAASTQKFYRVVTPVP